ncbi:unnamed protein product [Lactuca saligna]|uniref:Uncharacterized protein n=1 Tax=Lactuca saligna TaxID=75948 RepID=A0AA35ZVJ7_LACSI|nr:unnamed protein product [Lactuca saligna]
MNSSSIRSTSKKVNPSATSASPIFSFGHFRSYSMSAIPPSDAPMLPSSSMSSIDLQDQNQFSSRKSKDEKGEGEGLLSFRGLFGAGLCDDVFVGCFLSMSSTAVVAGGNGEQVLGRYVYRISQLFDFFRILSFYFTTVTIEKVVLEQSNSQYELQGEYVLLENEAY